MEQLKLDWDQKSNREFKFIQKDLNLQESNKKNKNKLYPQEVLLFLINLDMKKVIEFLKLLMIGLLKMDFLE